MCQRLPSPNLEAGLFSKHMVVNGINIAGDQYLRDGYCSVNARDMESITGFTR